MSELKIIKENNKYGYGDENGKVVIPCIWKEVGEFREGIAPVCNEEELWGYIDKEGNTIIPCQFENVSLWGDGLGLVSFKLNDPFQYYINKKGDIICSDAFSWITAKQIFKSMQLAEQSKYQEALDMIESLGEIYDEDEVPYFLYIRYCIGANQYDKLKLFVSTTNKFKYPCNVYSNQLKLEVAQIYEKGIGVDKNLPKALEWYNDIKDTGDEETDNLIKKKTSYIYEIHPELRPSQTILDETEWE